MRCKRKIAPVSRNHVQNFLAVLSPNVQVLFCRTRWSFISCNEKCQVWHGPMIRTTEIFAPPGWDIYVCSLAGCYIILNGPAEDTTVPLGDTEVQNASREIGLRVDLKMTRGEWSTGVLNDPALQFCLDEQFLLQAHRLRLRRALITTGDSLWLPFRSKVGEVFPHKAISQDKVSSSSTEVPTQPTYLACVLRRDGDREAMGRVIAHH